VARGNLVLGGGRGIALDADRARADRDAIATLAAQAVELLPTLRHAHFIRTWSGTEGNLPDHQPVLGPSRTTPGLFHGFGFSGAGFQIGPAAGEVLAELVRDGRSSTPIESFSIERFFAAAADEEAPTTADKTTTHTPP
jgi:sarcosine oxidase subunit beta